MSKIRTSRGFARLKNISRTPAEYASAVEITTSRPLMTIERFIVVALVAAIAVWVAV